MKIHPVILVFVFLSHSIYSQIDTVQYTSDFRFTDGIYVTSEQFRKNAPFTRDMIVTMVDKADMEFFAKLVRTESFQVILPDSTFRNVFSKDIFGFCQNNIIYVNLGGGFFTEMVKIGAICYIPIPGGGQRQGPTVTPSVGVGMGMGSYGYGGVGLGVGFTISGGGSGTPEEVIYHFNSGEGAEFTVEALAQFIRDDEILYNVFTSMKKREQKEEKYKILIEYNQRHPIYFPIYANQQSKIE